MPHIAVAAVTSRAVEQAPAASPVVLIPAYKPSSELIPVCQTLCASGEISAVVVVDDGSGEAYESTFCQLRSMPGVIVLQHITNLGKGAALKTGMNFIACSFKPSVGVVTADADGQHAVEDILRVGKTLSEQSSRLVVGGRLFDNDVPLRSRLGNTATKYVMRAFIGCNVSDTQSGLRGIPMSFVPVLLHSKATRYDFELDMLLKWHQKGNGGICEVPIRTIYIDGNSSSHFNPLLDSMRVYFVFLRFASTSLLTAGIDNLTFFIWFAILHQVLACFLIGRAVAGVFNYYVNKKEVFHSKVKNSFAVPRYLIAMIIAGFASYFALRGLMAVCGLTVLVSKVIAEGTLFFFSFIIQRTFVFSRRK